MPVGFSQRLAVVLAVALAAGGCGEEPVGRSPANRASSPHPNVLLISLDTLRADFVAEAPFLSRLAAEGRSFPNAIASSNWTLPTHVSLFTSLPYAVHNLPPPRSTAPHESTRIPGDWPTLAWALRDAGFYTAATTEGGWLDPRFGFAGGFDRFESSRPRFHGGTAVLADHVRLAREFLVEAADRPAFLFVHTYKVHDYFLNSEEYHDLLTADDAPYAALGNLLENVAPEQRFAIPDGFVRRLYAAGVRRADRFVEELVEALRPATGDVPWLVIVTSDHGESLGERGLWGHGGSLEDEQIRIPLIVRSYGGKRLAGRVDRPVSTVDVAPSLLAWLGLEPTAGFLGSPDLLADEVPPQRSPILSRFFLHHAERPSTGEVRQALIYRNTRYERADHFDGSLVSESCRVRDSDRFEELDAGGAEHPACAALRDDYARIRSPARGSGPGSRGELPPADRDLVDQLRALGYVGRE